MEWPMHSIVTSLNPGVRIRDDDDNDDDFYFVRFFFFLFKLPPHSLLNCGVHRVKQVGGS
jgi:hypothetical protein